jgi:hypothetical protein
VHTLDEMQSARAVRAAIVKVAKNASADSAHTQIVRPKEWKGLVI